MTALGVYIHWPYCARICPYCDFNVYRARGTDAEPLLAAIEADISAHAARFGKREAVSVFFGGGTPSLLEATQIERLLNAVDGAFGLAPDCEITLEANPEDAARFAEHAAAGITRFSVGVQALDDAALKALGRAHDASQARIAVEAAARTGRRVSLDLIYAREGQGVEAWSAELVCALELPIEHASLYQLTIEPETAFARRVARGDLSPPRSDLAAALYEATQEVCDAAGFHAYEISNHARGAAARSRHNLLYWRSEDWIGVGPGAHGRIVHDGVRFATEAHRKPADYIAAVRGDGIGLSETTALTATARGEEALLMGLRVAEGIDLAWLESVRGAPLDIDVVLHLRSQGFLTASPLRLQLTPRGRLVANRVAAELLH